MSSFNPPTARRLLQGIGAAALLLLIVIVATLPQEQTLGHTLKAVFVHAALVQTGLILFALGGVLGLTYLLRPGRALARWNAAAQSAALWTWVAYAISSMVATYMAWGIAVAWYEPRTRASAYVLGCALLFWGLSRWLADARFRAALNILTAVIAWVLVKGASLLRHPFDPIGTSDSRLFQAYFGAIFLLLLLEGGLFLSYLALGSPQRTADQRGDHPQRQAA